MSEENAVIEPQEEMEDVLNPEETPVEGSENTETEEGKSEEPKGKEEPKEKPKKSFDDRIAELKRQTWEAREAQRRAKEEADRLEALRSEQTPKKPNIDDYDDTAAFEKATDEYYKTVYENQSKQNARKSESAFAERQSYQAKQTKFDLAEREAEKNESYAKQRQEVTNLLREFQANEVARGIIEAQENGPKIITYLSQNPEEALELVQSSPQAVQRKLGIIEGRLTVKQPKKKITKAPDPINPGSTGGGGASGDPSKWSQAEYNAKMNGR